jgi:hypothetical protein
MRANLGISQVPEGHWYVNFEVSEDRTGWRALELVSWAAGETSAIHAVAIDVVGWFNGTEPEDGGESFELRGVGADVQAGLIAALGDALRNA